MPLVSLVLFAPSPVTAGKLLLLVVCVYNNDVCNFVSLLATCRQKTFWIDGQQLWDCVVKFAGWQHLAVGCGARFAVPSTNCFNTVVPLLHLYCLSAISTQHLAFKSELLTRQLATG